MSTVQLLVDLVTWCISCSSGSTAPGGFAAAAGAAAAAAAAVAGTAGAGAGSDSGAADGDAAAGSDAAPAEPAEPGHDGSGHDGGSAAGGGHDGGPIDAPSEPEEEPESEAESPDPVLDDPTLQDHDGPVDVENVTPDGDHIFEHEGDPNTWTQHPDGSLDVTRPDGSLDSHTAPDGTTTKDFPDGTETTFNHDGSRFEESGPPNARIGQEINPDGSNGATYEYDANHDIAVQTDADGTTTYYNDDGSRDVFSTDADGNRTGVTYEPGDSTTAHPYHSGDDPDPWGRPGHEDAPGSGSVNADGSTPNGMFQKDGTLVFRSDTGVTDTYTHPWAPDQVHTTTLPDGTTSTYDSATGVTTVHLPNGTTQIISPDGTTTAKLPDGQIIQQRADGTHAYSDPDDGTDVFAADGSQISHTDAPPPEGQDAGLHIVDVDGKPVVPPER